MDVKEEGERLLDRKRREIEAGARACRERAAKAHEGDYEALSGAELVDRLLEARKLIAWAEKKRAAANARQPASAASFQVYK